MNGSTISNIYLQQGRIRPCLQLNDKLMALKLIMFNLQYKKSVFILHNDSLDILVIYFQPVHRKMFHLIIKHFTT